MTARSKILLVDDEKAITDNLSPFLERLGFVVAVAADGEETLGQVASFIPDLIVLDILMPKIDGREALRRLRGENNWTPVILLTPLIRTNWLPGFVLSCGALAPASRLWPPPTA